jgi:hypothetical protein
MSERLARISPFSLEPLESRQLLSVSLDASGWTVVTPSEDTRKIYVSSLLGNDANDGLSSATPVRTIAQGVSLLRDGSPDWLLLRRGDIWNEGLGSWKKSGRSADEPLLISSYGTTRRRPILKTGAFHGIYAQNEAVNFVSIIGIHLYASSRDPASTDFTGSTDVTGIRWLVPSKDLLIEDTIVQGYSTNIFISPELGVGPTSDVSIRRSIVTDAYSILGHSAGALLGGIDGLTLEGNVFDHNGWNELIVGAEPTTQNHNIYLVQNNKNVTVKDNIIANASSHGLQARAGGNIVNNLFINNPIAISFGMVNGTPETAGGVSGRIDGNVFAGSRDIDGQSRGYAIEIGNLRPGGQTTIAGNLFLGDEATASPAIQLSYGKTGGFPSGTVGINDLTIEKNIILGWAQALYTNPSLIPGSVGPLALNNLTVRNNDFQQTTQSQIITHAGVFDPLQEHFSANRYYALASDSNWFSVNRTPTSFDSWRALIEPTAIIKKAAYPDATRSIATYNASLGGFADALSFVAMARKQAKFNWNEQYTPKAAKNYLQPGFFVIGDANMDGSVTIADVIILSSNWAKPDQDWTSGDFNGDGVVTVSDFIDLTSNFGVLT